jgi:hypothetical protein
VWFFDWDLKGSILSFLKLGQRALFFKIEVHRSALLELYGVSGRACVRKGILGLYSYVLHKDTVT